MARSTDLLLTAIAPAIWGSTYLVTTELLSDGYPVTVAMLRALPAGLLLLLVARQLPAGAMWFKVLILGALNFSIFWSLLFLAAYRLPGGVAATVGAIQPLFVIFLARTILGSAIRVLAIVAAVAGFGGVALLILTPQAALDPLGLLAGLGGAVSMAFGTVLSRRWQAPVPPLTFAAWQLTAGGALLVPFVIWFEPALPNLNGASVLGLAYLGLIGAALTYILWFRGVARLGPSVVATLGFLSPMTAVVLGWAVLGQSLSPLQIIGVLTVLGSIWLSQHSQSPKASAPLRSIEPQHKAQRGEGARRCV